MWGAGNRVLFFAEFADQNLSSLSEGRSPKPRGPAILGQRAESARSTSTSECGRLGAPLQSINTAKARPAPMLLTPGPYRSCRRMPFAQGDQATLVWSSNSPAPIRAVSIHDSPSCMAVTSGSDPLDVERRASRESLNDGIETTSGFKRRVMHRRIAYASQRRHTNGVAMSRCDSTNAGASGYLPPRRRFQSAPPSDKVCLSV